MNKKLLKVAALSALGQVGYILLVATIMRNFEKFFPKEDNFFSPVTFLLLFVLSAAISGALVLGRPILMYLDGKKKEAVELFIYILVCLFVLFLISAMGIILVNNFR